MKLAKTCLAVLLGVAIGMVVTTQIRTVKAQGGTTVFVDYVNYRNGPQKVIKARGSRVVGFSCTVEDECVVTSQ